MQKKFNTSANLSEAEQALKAWGIKYEKQPDGNLLVPGDIDISNKGLVRLPDLSRVTVSGHFFCDHNQLTSLEHAPQIVGRGFYCNNNQLTSLEHAPHTVGGSFRCSNNLLTSLEHAPHTINGGFYCNDNRLTSLEHAPKNFQELKSDFGEFAAWGDVPEKHRFSAQAKTQLEQEQQAAIYKSIHEVTVLQDNIAVKKPFRFAMPKH